MGRRKVDLVKRTKQFEDALSRILRLAEEEGLIFGWNGKRLHVVAYRPEGRGRG